jgi:hypothetical protein
MSKRIARYAKDNGYTHTRWIGPAWYTPMLWELSTDLTIPPVLV